MDPLRFIHPVMTAKEQRAIADIKGTPQEMPAQPFSTTTALWLCRACSWWNAPERTCCRECQGVRG
jgi:hypothetical protein